MELNRRGFFGRLAGLVALVTCKPAKKQDDGSMVLVRQFSVPVDIDEMFSVPMTWPKNDNAVYYFTSDGVYRNGELIS